MAEVGPAAHHAATCAGVGRVLAAGSPGRGRAVARSAYVGGRTQSCAPLPHVAGELRRARSVGRVGARRARWRGGRPRRCCGAGSRPARCCSATGRRGRSSSPQAKRAPAEAAAGGVLPLGLGRQPLAGPGGSRPGRRARTRARPGGSARRRRPSAAVRMPPVGAAHGEPPRRRRHAAPATSRRSAVDGEVEDRRDAELARPR